MCHVAFPRDDDDLEQWLAVPMAMEGGEWGNGHAAGEVPAVMCWRWWAVLMVAIQTQMVVASISGAKKWLGGIFWASDFPQDH